MDSSDHLALLDLRQSLQEIYEASANYHPVTDNLPILDSSTYLTTNGEDGQKVQSEEILGLGRLRESVKADLDSLEKFLAAPDDAERPPAWNASYLIAVWNEIICAPPPVETIFKAMPLKRKKGGQRPPMAHVDVIADGGKRWIRVNTVKNSRLLAEFREADSYLTGSDDSSYEDSAGARPSLVPPEFDNSLLQMCRTLLAAAKANSVQGIGVVPKVTLRLTRLQPSSNNEDIDPRIGQTVRLVQEMGITVEFGERLESELPRRVADVFVPPKPALNLNLDLSVVIALTSDEQARFSEWKQSDDYIKRTAGPAQDTRIQEKGLFEEIHDKIFGISSDGSSVAAKFWTTPDARDRCLRIVAKIGTPTEKRRAHALFSASSTLCTDTLSEAEAEEVFWQDTLYPFRFLPIFPLNLLPSQATLDLASLGSEIPIDAKMSSSRFSRTLAKTCQDILDQKAKGTARLTAHTVKCLLWGAELGWTTVTANRTSVKAILREIKLARTSGRLGGIPDATEDELVEDNRVTALIWVVDAEGRDTHLPQVKIRETS